MRRVVSVLILSSLLCPGSVFAQEAPAPEAVPSTEEAPAADPGASVEGGAAAEGSSPGVAPGNEGGIKDRSVHESRPMGLSAMVYIPWWYGIGIGVNARFEIPIVKDGFIPSINDQISLEPSLAIGYRSRNYGWVGAERLKFIDITPAIYAMWSFHITPKFRPYGALGLGYNIGVWLNDDDFGGRDVNGGFFYFDLAAGLFYNFSEHIALRAELGAQGPKVGLSGFF